MHHLFSKKSCNSNSENKSTATSTLPRKVRIVTWVNILIQLLFPLSLSFTPAIAALAASHSASAGVATEPYTLSAGESITSVAKKYDLSIDELIKLNNYRTFSKPFAELTTGDEIDVPSKRSPFSVDNQPNLTTENKLAGYAMSGGTVLASGNVTQSAQQAARSIATQAVNDAAQQWFNQFGTARVQLNVNQDFHLDGSAIDVLLPWYDNQKNLLFTQLGARHKDGRNTVNAGAGFRTFQGNWMYGINSFFDHDITGHNRRVGIGAEAWTHYLKLSANSYFGLTDWHQSRDFADYNERPANGYDVRAEAYLPTYPQLGSKLTYEQYRGNEVALFGKDNRQKDPYAFTAGLNYTPIPLLTLEAEHRAGKSGQSDSSVNLQFNYRLGQSWQTHIDPSAVAASRTLAGSRHDLVDRNHHIVLDYQKQELIRLSLPEMVSGEANSTVMVNAQVNSKYGLERIEWESATLVAAGGTLTQVSSETFAITLPSHQKAGDSNIYTLSAVAHDRQGNSSARVSVQVSVSPGTASLISGNLTVIRDNAVSNGTATNAVQAIVTDADNQPMAGQKVTFTADNNARVTTVIETTDLEGIAIAEVAHTMAGTSRVTATVNGASQYVDMMFIADSDNLDNSKSTLSATPASIVADGNTASTLTLTLKDVNNNPVIGQTVLFASDLVNSSVEMTGDNEDGTYTARLTGTTAGTANITVTVDDRAFAVNAASVTLKGNGNDLSVGQSTLVTDVATLVANGSDNTEVTLTLHDSHGNRVTGQAVVFVSTLGNVSAARETANGIYTATLTAGTQAGAANITATVGSTALTGLSATVTFNGNGDDLSVDKSTLVTDAPILIANGTNNTAVTLTLQDRHGNPVSGQTVVFTTTLGKVSAASETANGIYTATLTAGTAAGEANITASAGSTALSGLSAIVTFIGNRDDPSLWWSTLETDVETLVANGTDNTEVTLTIQDRYGNPVSDQTVEFITTLGKVSAARETANGTYTATLTAGTEAGEAHIIAIAGNTLLNGVSATVTFNGNGNDLSVDKSTLVTGAPTLVANGTDSTAVRLTLQDSHGNRVTGQLVVFTTTLGKVSAASETASGVYTATLTAGTAAGAANITATAGSTSLTGLSATVTFNGNGNDLSVDKSTLVTGVQTLVANGSDNTEVTLTLQDSHGNPVTGQTVVFTTTLGKVSAASETANGIYTAILTAGTEAGEANITATAGSTALTGLSATVTFNGNGNDLSVDKSTLVTGVQTLVANGSDNTEVTLTLQDSHGNRVSGQAVVFTTTLGNVSAARETANGIYTAILTAGTAAGAANITATAGNAALTGLSATVTFNGNGNDLSIDKSTLVTGVDTLVANGVDNTEVTLTLQDSHGNRVSGQPVVFTTTLGNVTAVRETANGVYTATLTAGTEAGVANMTATAGSTVLTALSATVTFNGNGNDLSVDKSTLVTGVDTLVANGADNTEVTLTLQDSHGNRVSGQTVVFTTTLGNVSAARETANGTYTATLTAGTEAGEANITATAGSAALTGLRATVTFNGNGNDLSVDKSTLVTGVDTLVANGADNTEVTLTLQDSHGNRVSGQAVVFTTTLGNVTAVRETANGVYTATLTAGTEAGSANITATAGGTALTGLSATVTFNGNGNDLSVDKSTLVTGVQTLVANGSDNTEVTLTLQDSHGNPVTGQTVVFTTTLGKVSAASETANGIYTATLTAGTAAGSANITATAGSTALTGLSATVTFNGNGNDLSVDKSTLMTGVQTLVANGTDNTEVTLTLQDSHGNRVSGQTVVFTTTLGKVSAARETASGIYTVTLTAGTEAGAANITATAGSTALTGLSATVTFNGNGNDLSVDKSTLVTGVQTLVANGTDNTEVTLTLQDSHGNPVTGQTVVFSTTLGKVSAARETANGIYTATLTASTEAGAANITATVGSTVLTGLSATVTLIGDSKKLSATNSRLVASPTALEANDTDTARVTLTLRDINNNLVGGQTVVFATTLGTIGVVSENSTGVYTATLTAGTLAGIASLTATVGGSRLTGVSASVTINGDSKKLSTTLSRLVASPTALEANGSNISTLTLTLRDINNNPVNGQSVTFMSTPSGLGTIGNLTIYGAGVYRATFTAGTTSGTASVSVRVNSSAFNTPPATIVLTTVLRTSPNQLGSVNIPAGYDLVEFSLANANWSREAIVLPSTGVKNGNKITINSTATYDSYLNTSNTNIPVPNPLVIVTGTSYTFIYNSTSGLWVKS
ncbi:hypothetical protein C9426_25220 [Serratia sp. S1B]|nr:hypothetical protein C9426_25220 [Serratia sp. S1B]